MYNSDKEFCKVIDELSIKRKEEMKKYKFDKDLCEFCESMGCSINVEGEEVSDDGAKTFIRFDPEPSIWANDNIALAHEICHLLGGKEDYDLFKSTVDARNCDIFMEVLNTLFDEYHESLYGQHSDALYKYLRRDRETKLPVYVNIPIDIPILDAVYKSLLISVPGEKMNVGVKTEKASDLVTLADFICEDVLPKEMAERNLTKSNVIGRMNWRRLGWWVCLLPLPDIE